MGACVSFNSVMFCHLEREHVGKPQNGDLPLGLVTRIIRKSSFGVLSQVPCSKLFSITAYSELIFSLLFN